jgi:histidinol-phosphate/aromatic aminotransferase/cobyric acid decarboxylase-like protein
VTAPRCPDYYDVCYVETHRLRSDFVEGLKQIGISEIIPGKANFVLFHLPDHGPDGATVISECQQQGLFIRDASEMGSRMGDRAIRIAIKDTATNQKMLGILDSILQQNTMKEVSHE